LGVLPKKKFDESKNALEEAEVKRREAEAQIERVRKFSPDSRNEQMASSHLKYPGSQQAVIERLEAELAQRHPETLVLAAHFGPTYANQAIRRTSRRDGRKRSNLVLAVEGSRLIYSPESRRLRRIKSRR
jgi:hypothetical protein